MVELRRAFRPVPATAGIRAFDLTAERLRWLATQRPASGRPPRWTWAVALGVAALVLPGAGVAAPQEHPLLSSPGRMADALQSRADEALEAEDWEEAARLYKAVLEEKGNYGIGWLRLGYALQQLGKADEAIEAYREASHHPGLRNRTLFHWACALSLDGEREAALEKLKESLDAGYARRPPLAEVEALAGLRDYPGFAELAERHRALLEQAASRPSVQFGTLPTDAATPMLVPEMKSLDNEFRFREGLWEVKTSSGNLLGTSVITIDDATGEAVETWTAADGGSAPVTNSFNLAARTWEQSWINGEKQTLEIREISGDERALTLSGTARLASGETARCQLHFRLATNGILHQQMLSSIDGGPWRTVYNGFYWKKAGPAASTGE